MEPSPSAFSMAKTYDPQAVEQRLYRWWESRGYFTPRIERDRRPFVIIMPPPNVTGELHLGHALTTAIEDALVRWHRMRGEPTLWLPGTDHAGIATQNVVERDLAKERLTRHDLGREQFVERVWDWVRRYGGIIHQQLRRIGASCDWTRHRFTMDPGPSLAVRTTFVNLYDRGLIYRGKRLINWCPRCMTAISDLEVDHDEADGRLYYLKYPVAEPVGPDYVVVATTRPETMLGDTAIAVHPADERYTGVEGKDVILPILRRRIPVIADPAVDLEFGTGAVKVTPAHDPNDFDMGQRHGLPAINVMNPDGTMNVEAGPYAGLDRFEARRRLVADLQAQGLIDRIEPHRHAIGHCQRCDTIVEPLISEQWFVRIKPLADPAIAAVLDGRIAIVPERFTRVYLNWMENIRDWCISRQLWWGHRIPVWYCRRCGEQTVAVADPAMCTHCASPEIEQDPDVLDTWFSSGLWPHSTLGWPEHTADLDFFYPTSVMETGYDILFFWVARMIMLGIENTGQVPFRTVYLHGLVRDEKGEKMSKSKRNVVDPLQVMASYGTDALRFTLATGSTPGNDMKLSPQRLEASRNFANKLWNIARFITAQPGEIDGSTLPAMAALEDRWILSRLNRLAASVDQLLTDFQIGEAGRQIHDFVWGELADWYVELAKIRQRDSAGTSPLPVLVHAFEQSLRLLHPFMPFVTEELWQLLRQRFGPLGPEAAESIMIARYPTCDPGRIDEAAEHDMDLLMGIIRAIRNARAEYRVEEARSVEVVVEAGDRADLLRRHMAAIVGLARATPVTIADWLAEKPQQAVSAIVDRAAVYLPLAGLLDLSAERARVEKELAEARQEIARLEAKLGNPQFVAKAPPAVVDKERERLAAARDRLAKLEERQTVLGD
ncbi:MAG: valine--tRNA ligase [Chloroflexi bacterium]|nr:valine--tRNA ligase [Chloroflexota bacterium]